MAKISVQRLTDYEQFLARELHGPLSDLPLMLIYLERELPREEFLRIAAPLFSAAKALGCEVSALHLRNPEWDFDRRCFLESLNVPAALFSGGREALR